jgi:hypothetical protein
MREEFQSRGIHPRGWLAALPATRDKSHHRKRNKWFEEKFHKENPPATVHNYVGIYRLTDVRYSVTSGIENWNNSHRIAKTEGARLLKLLLRFRPQGMLRKWRASLVLREGVKYCVPNAT